MSSSTTITSTIKQERILINFRSGGGRRSSNYIIKNTTDQGRKIRLILGKPLLIIPKLRARLGRFFCFLNNHLFRCRRRCPAASKPPCCVAADIDSANSSLSSGGAVVVPLISISNSNTTATTATATRAAASRSSPRPISSNNNNNNNKNNNNHLINVLTRNNKTTSSDNMSYPSSCRRLKSLARTNSFYAEAIADCLDFIKRTSTTT